MLLKYPNYKDSGVEWIGEIPEGWEVRKLKYVASVKYGLGQPPKEKSDGLPIIRATNVYRGKIDINNLVFVDPDDVPYERDPILRENDIIVVRSGAYTADSAIIPKEFDGAIAGYDMVVRCESVKSKFISYCLLSDYVLKKQLLLHSLRAAQPHLNREELSETIFALPTIPEQTDIASFLQCKTAELDQLISNKEKLITLYEEEKTAIINRAVTKGLDLYVRLKPSGVEWLGDIPEHWEAKKLKHVIDSIGGGGTPATGNPLFWEGTIPWVSPKDMKVDYIVKTEDNVTELAVTSSSTNLIEPEQVLIVVRSGILKHTLPVAINKVVVCLNQDMKAIKPFAGMYTKFFFWKLKGISKEILTFCNKMGATVDSIEVPDLLNLLFTFPSIPEQSAIVAHIEVECSRLDTIINKFEKQIDLFKEYRTTLISEVVTGKIDVRGEVAV